MRTGSCVWHATSNHVTHRRSVIDAEPRDRHRFDTATSLHPAVLDSVDIWIQYKQPTNPIHTNSTKRRVMANASSKRITSSNQAALKRLTYTFGLTHAAHLILRFLLRPRPFFSGPSYLLFLLFLATGFAYSFLRTVGKPRRDRNGVLRGSVELEGNEGGVVEWVLDFFYFACGLQALTPLLGYKFYYFILIAPIFALYKIYAFASPLLFGRAGSSSAATRAGTAGAGSGPDGQKKEELTKTQAKKAKKMEKMERMQMNNRR